jgi:hypothetical protein
MLTDVTLFAEHNYVNLWQSPPVIVAPAAAALRSFADAQTRCDQESPRQRVSGRPAWRRGRHFG